MAASALQYRRPGHFLLHLSDTHFPAGGLLYGLVDVENHLTRVLGQFVAAGNRPDAVVITGDLTDKGEAGGYARLRAVVEPAARRMGARVVWVMGNHDRRGEFRTGLLDESPTDEPVDRVYDFAGLRLIALDTTVPGAHHGAVTDQQLGWLAAELSTPAEHGTLLAMHHPPLPSLLDLAVPVELRDQQRLAEVLAGTDVRAIIAGHLHHSTFGTFAGIGVSVASATCYTQDLAVPAGAMRTMDGAQSVNLIHVYQSTVLHSIVAVEQYPALRFTSPEQAAAQLTVSGFPPGAPPPSPAAPADISSLSQGAGMAK